MTARGGVEAWLRAVRDLLLGFPIALFTSAMLTDIAYLKTAELQWSNFSAWLITGALVAGALALIAALIEVPAAIARGANGRNAMTCAIALALAWGLGLVNAFKHSQDGWSSVETFGMILSILSTLLAIVAGLLAYAPEEDAR
ncbi:hypothetical protein P7B02_03925 [Caulobacter segnis]|uniref:DUF2231 domain-containing protein n=1 Tax=Caulobacter segnis TaxID=88688 RepID=UPI0024105BF6|nr:DUF2231 domain-containing protein [Caulobacter segnis]MDG2520681.1 hypothetical protein [Caulobacter segnis]